MNKKIKFKTTLLLVMVVMVSVSAFPDIYVNWGECPFAPGCSGSGGGESNVYVPSSSGLMAPYIIEGAGYILDARAGVSIFLNRFETGVLNGVDFSEMRDIISGVIGNLESAQGNYIFIDYIAAGTPYEASVIERLITFDYDGFQERNGLYSNIFTRVRSYLSSGDVRGIWKAIITDIDLLLDQLYTLKAVLDTDNLPNVESVWQLNQSFSNNIFFGQYISMVLFQVKDE